MKRIWLYFFAITMVFTALITTQATEVPCNHYPITGEHSVNYLELMLEAARDGSAKALSMGAEYEKKRNDKIQMFDLPYLTTSYFQDYDDGALIESKILSKLITAQFNEEDIDLMTRLVYAEAGSSWLPDELQLHVGSVILNRIANDCFPDTLYDVVYQKGQYAPMWTGAINNTPDERTIANVMWLIENGSISPINVVWQAEFKQGKTVYWSYYNEVSGSTTYICAS